MESERKCLEKHNNLEMAFSRKQEIEHNLSNHKAFHKLFFESAYINKQEKDRYTLLTLLMSCDKS